MDTLQLRLATIDTIDYKTTTIVVLTIAKRDELNKHFVQKLSSANNPLFMYINVNKDTTGKPLSKRLQQIVRGKEHAKTALPEHLQLCKGARVLHLRNSHVKKGWVNGMMCIVQHCTKDVVFVRNSQTNERTPIFRVVQVNKIRKSSVRV